MTDSTCNFDELVLAHLSDTHIAHEAFPARAPSGWNLRGEDMVRAFRAASDAIVELDPPLVIHSGDVSEVPNPPVRYMLAIRAELARLGGIRADGTRRQVVVIAGNHDFSRLSRGGCYLDLYRGQPGVHIVTHGIERIDFCGEGDDIPSELEGTTVWAVPHESLRDLESTDPRPIEGRRNILVAHGVAESSEIYTRSVGREYVIPASLMVQDWDYVALGHFHMQGPVTPVGARRGAQANIWYAGSTESVDFGDCRAAVVSERGWLEVRSTVKGVKVIRRRHATRAMVTLAEINAKDQSPDAIAEKLVSQVKAAPLHGAVVRQRVTAVSRDLWAMVDTASAREAADAALMYRIDARFSSNDVLGDPDGTDGTESDLGAIGDLIARKVAAGVPEKDREAVLAMSLRLTGESVSGLAGESDETEATGEKIGSEKDTSEKGETDEAAKNAVGVPGDNGPGSTSEESCDSPSGDGNGSGEHGEAHGPGEVKVPPPLSEAARAEALASTLEELEEDGKVEVAL